MTEHLCSGKWVEGKVAACPHHVPRGTSAPDVRPYDDRRTRLRVAGVAKTGEVSKKGTVEHTDYYSGRVAVTAKPSAVNVALRDMPWFRERFVYREGGWVEQATGKAIQWLQGSNGSKRSSTSPESRNGSSPPKVPPMAQGPKSVRNSLRYGVTTGRTSVSLDPAPSNRPL